MLQFAALIFASSIKRISGFLINIQKIQLFQMGSITGGAIFPPGWSKKRANAPPVHMFKYALPFAQLLEM